MKKNKKKIVYILAVIGSIILSAILSNGRNSLSSSDIFTVEALAGEEGTKYNCVADPGFCIIDGIAQLGVTYKE